ncbi:TPA: hypothetical protein IXP62_002964 [Enterococcus faecium]|nr:hypothetical protein [Enterococcus faecium]
MRSSKYTEHFDLANPVTKVDDIPDYEMYSQTIDSLNKRFGNRVLKGIEIGYIASEKDRIIDYLADKDYDLKLLSVHHNGQFDYLDDEVKDMDPAIVIPQYFAQLSEALVVIEADVFAHFDYGFRVFGLSVAEFKQYEAQFLPILDQVIKNKLAFELNAKSAYLYDNLALYEYVIDLYLSRGGTLFSVGSDGHYLEHFRFDDLFALLKAKGVTELAIYQKGKRIMVPLQSKKTSSASKVRTFF